MEQPRGASSGTSQRCRPLYDFAELDREIETYQSSMLSSGAATAPSTGRPIDPFAPSAEGKGARDGSPGGSGASRSTPLFKRLISSIRGNFCEAVPHERSGMGVVPPSGVDNSMAPSNERMVTCRLCESEISSARMGEHTEWCCQVQDCEMRRETCQAHFAAISEQLLAHISEPGPMVHMLSEARPERALVALHDFVQRAIGVDEESGRPAAVSLAKIQYKLAKVDFDRHASPMAAEVLGECVKRTKYLIEQKRVLAERFADLLPREQGRLGEPHHTILPSYSASDSSLDSTPKRPTTPVARLTTLFAAIVKGTRSITRSPSLQCTSPPKPSTLRSRAAVGGIGIIPKIADFEILKPISRGAFGRVYLARKKSTKDLYAIKALLKRDMIGKNMTSHVMTERKVMSLSKTPYVVTLYYAFESKDYLFLVMEYLIGGDFSSVLQERGRLPEDIARFYMAELVLALCYLHEHGIIHRDIKPDNMLLDEGGHLKLTDFGLANFGFDRRASAAGTRGHTPPLSAMEASDCEEGGASEGGCSILGTPDYLAPEILHQQDHGTAVDWWAFGVCLYEMLLGIPPFSGSSPGDIFDKILKHQSVDWDFVDGEAGCKGAALYPSLEARDLIERLLVADPDRRLGSSQVQGHPFFKGIEWEQLRSHAAPLRPSPMNEVDTSCFEARNRRYEALGLPEDFTSAEPVGGIIGYLPMSSTAFSYLGGGGDSTPLGMQTPPPMAPSRGTASPFDGFVYKNVNVLSRVNRNLSSTPASFTGLTLEPRRSLGNLSDTNNYDRDND